MNHQTLDDLKQQIPLMGCLQALPARPFQGASLGSGSISPDIGDSVVLREPTLERHALWRPSESARKKCDSRADIPYQRGSRR